MVEQLWCGYIDYGKYIDSILVQPVRGNMHTWKVNMDHLIKHKQNVMVFKRYPRFGEKFGTSPVKNCYMKIQKQKGKNMDLSEEMVDLMKSYEESLENLKVLHHSRLEHVVYYMKSFIEVYQKKHEIQGKLDSLKRKMKEYEDEEGEE